MIVDTHLHLVDRTALSYPWLAGEPRLQGLQRRQRIELDRERVGVE